MMVLLTVPTEEESEGEGQAADVLESVGTGDVRGDEFELAEGVGRLGGQQGNYCDVRVFSEKVDINDVDYDDDMVDIHHFGLVAVDNPDHCVAEEIAGGEAEENGLWERVDLVCTDPLLGQKVQRKAEGTDRVAEGGDTGNEFGVGDQDLFGIRDRTNFVGNSAKFDQNQIQSDEK
jgi:hypothetical protein